MENTEKDSEVDVDAIDPQVKEYFTEKVIVLIEKQRDLILAGREPDSPEEVIDDPRKKLERYEALQFEIYKQLIDDGHTDFFYRCALESWLNIKDGKAIFASSIMHPHFRGIGFKEMAELLLERLETSAVDNPLEYVSIAEYAIAEMGLSEYVFLRHKDSQSLFHFMHDLMSDLNEEFNSKLGHACWHVYHGVPIFCQESDGAFRMVDFRDEDYIFMKKYGEEYITGDMVTIPEWSKKYYFKRRHLEAHDIFFSTGESEKHVADLRIALQRHLQIPSDDIANYSSGAKLSRLHSILIETMELYKDAYPYPKQEILVKELMNRHGLSQRQASAIDIVARPDSDR